MTLTIPNVVVYFFPLLLWLLLWALFYYPLAHGALLSKAGIRKGAGWLAGTRPVKWLSGRSAWKGMRSYAPILVVVAVGGLAAASAGYLFIELARSFRLPTSSVYRMDQGVRTWFIEARQPGTTNLLKTLTFFGGFYGLLLVMTVIAALLFWAKQRATAVYLLVTGLGGMLLNVLLKSMFARARPEMDLELAVATWYSFPSGHAMGSFVLYAALAYVALRQTWAWKADSAALAAAITMIFLIGISRVYLGVHWTSDIAGGWSAAAVWVAATTMAYEMLLRQRQRRRGAQLPASPSVDIPDKPVPAES